MFDLRTVSITSHDQHGFHTMHAIGVAGPAWACGTSANDVAGALFLYCAYGDVELPSGGTITFSTQNETNAVKLYRRAQNIRTLAYRTGSTYDALQDGVYFAQDDVYVTVIDAQWAEGRVYVDHPFRGELVLPILSLDIPTVN